MHFDDKQDSYFRVESKLHAVARFGLSTLEISGCIAAIGAGLWLGAMVVGFDLREAWNMGVRQVGFTSCELEMPESEDPTDGSENLERSGFTSEEASDSPKAKTAEGPSVGEQTLIYWNQLNAIMTKEEEMRRVPSSGLTSANASIYLSGRGNAYRYAAKAIRGLPSRGVDQAVSHLAHNLATWYDRGGEVSNQGVRIMNSGSSTVRQGPMGKEWQAAEKQHQNELLLINSRSTFLHEQMISKYKLAFPDLR